MQHLSHLFRLLPPLLALSFVTNLAIIISPLFMMQVLDRVIPSGNQTTLMLLGLLAAGALLLQAVIEAARDKSLGRIARWVERTGTAQAITAPNAQEHIEQLARVSKFLSGNLAVTVLNLPWLPLLAGVLLLLHPAFLFVLLGLLLVSSALRGVTNILQRPHNATAEKCASMEEACLTKSVNDYRLAPVASGR